MATVREILARKGSTVVTVSPDTSVLDAARLMNERGIGAVVVVERGSLVGIFTERDVMRRVVAAERAPATTPVRAVLSPAVITTQHEAPVEDCAALMTERRIRHLPVEGPDGLSGMITIGDLLAHQVSEQALTIEQLNSYLYDTR
ncbi:MAG: CBS domain-containing protein [Gemmatimonadales bacterium]|nr:CBS domain-containing protein [Gemmatimonadales bacterium]